MVSKQGPISITELITLHNIMIYQKYNYIIIGCKRIKMQLNIKKYK